MGRAGRRPGPSVDTLRLLFWQGRRGIGAPAKSKREGRNEIMQCVYYDDKLPNGFTEQFFFSAQMPYTLGVKRFSSEDNVPLHYADTIEILLCRDLCGEIVIDTQHYPLGGKQLFVIPPYTVHENHVFPGEGIMYVLKISLQEMERYLNLPNFLSLRGCCLWQLQYLCPEYEGAKAALEGLIEKDGDLMQCLPEIMGLFSLLSRHIDQEREPVPARLKFKSSSLQELILWTNDNFYRKITIDEAAEMTGYSKYHFCSRFKAQTGMTYIHYLNSVRVSQACLMLRSGEPVQTVCRSCGFENVSYFIQVFKRFQHVTPYQYKRGAG